MWGAYCALSERLDFMYQTRVVLAPNPTLPGSSRYTWVSIGVDGSIRWDTGYVRYAMPAPFCEARDEACRWPFEGCERWATAY